MGQAVPIYFVVIQDKPKAFHGTLSFSPYLWLKSNITHKNYGTYLKDKVIHVGYDEQILQNEKALINEMRFQVVEYIIKHQDDIKKRYDRIVKKWVFMPSD